MNDPSALKSASVEELVGQVADEFRQRLCCGERPTIEEYTRRHPHLAAILGPVLTTLRELEPLLPGPEPTNARPATEPIVAGRLGDFRIQRLIGRGGMGVVYEAEQISVVSTLVGGRLGRE
jgi:hypothetical protein